MRLSRQDTIRKLKENFDTLKRFKVKRIGIFGSSVRDEVKENSDIDIVVEFEKALMTKDYDNLMDGFAQVFVDFGLEENKYLIEFIFIVSRASICSVILIMPISAAIEEPALPIIITAVSTGPSSLIMDKATAAPKTPSEPNLTKV